MTGSGTKKISLVLMIFIFATAAIYWLCFILLSDIRKIIYIIPDDASYYFKIAENFSKGNGMTFDGLHYTTGFQPLWEYILTVVMFAAKVSPENFLRIVLVIQIIFLCVACILFYKSLSVIYSDEALLSGFIFFIVFVFFKSINGMETSLLVLMISLLFFFAVRKKFFWQYNLRDEFLFGALFGLIVLSRLDMIFFLVPVLTYLAIKTFQDMKLKASLIRILNLAFAVSIILIPYIFYNFFSSGNFIPISGYLKSTFPEITSAENFFILLKYREIYFALAAVVFVILIQTKFISTPGPGQSTENYFLFILKFFAFGIILLFSYIVFFMKWVLFPWYFVSFSIFISLLICIIADRILRQKNQAYKILFQSVMIFVLCYYSYKMMMTNSKNYETFGSSWGIESYNAALWAKKNTSASDIFAMKDAGHFGFFSERNVISLDGLVNDFEYQDVIKNKSLNNYLKKNKVKYLVQHAVQNKNVLNENYSLYPLNYFSHRYSAVSDTVIVGKDDEVYRSEPYDENDITVFIIWKIN